MMSKNGFHLIRCLISRSGIQPSECANRPAVLFRDMAAISSHFPRTMATCGRVGCRALAHDGKFSPVLTLKTLNPNIIEMQYAVRGQLVIRASEIEKELEKGVQKPFNEVIKANIGDCHAMGQLPITFIREVLALVSCPILMDDPKFPDDVKARAQLLLCGCKGGSVGSYSDSPGIEVIRRHAAEYIEKRDGIPSSWENIIMSAGASQGIKSVMKLLIAEVDCKTPGVMIPIPQYPLYSATLSEYGFQQIGYYLNEEKNWGLDIDELHRAIAEARKECHPRALVVINPGNPTGQVLSRNNIEEIIKFAYQEKLFIFADEVYQHNVYAEGCKFHSFKKVLTEMGPPYSAMELASFMSASKGYMGECGLRGGYCELTNLDPEVKAMYHKSISAALCPTVVGQVVMDCVVKPPEPGDVSYDQYIQEKTNVLESLAVRAKMVADTFNSVKGMSCNTVQGAMYAFPQLHLPPKAIKAAEEKKLPADTFYAFELLENTGICVIPGSGFGQKPGTYHFRTTILPQPDKLKRMLDKFKEFHGQFLQKYE